MPGSLDRLHSAWGRREQGFLRQQLFGVDEKAACGLCGSVVPTNLLIAAHIKARAHCTPKQRRDTANVVFAACSLGCDSLYERGYIAVDASGVIVVSQRKSIPKFVRSRMNAVAGKRCGAWIDGSAAYFAWHLATRFQG
jgi:hypothetical protein